jgi:hypothetical protein
MLQGRDSLAFSNFSAADDFDGAAFFFFSVLPTLLFSSSVF